MCKNQHDEFYERFHKGSRSIGYIPTQDDSTYGDPIAFLDGHLPVGGDVLDLGCGIGAISLHIASKGNSVLGVDISSLAITAARADAEKLGLSNVEFMTGDITEVEFQRQFDAVLCFDVLEHVEDDVSMLCRINSLLKSGGCLLLRVPSECAPVHRVRVFLNGYDGFDRQVGHLRRYCRDSLESLLEETGFREAEIKGTEGFLRNLLFTSRLGARARPLLARDDFRRIFNAMDDFARMVLGPSGFNIATVKIGEANMNEKEDQEL